MTAKEKLMALGEFAKMVEELKKQPVYDAGDETYLTVESDTDGSLFDELADQIRLGAKGRVFENDVNGNRCIYAEMGKGYIGAFGIPCRGEVRTLVHNEEIGIIPEQLCDSDSYSDRKTFIQFCPDDSKEDFGMCYIVCLGKGHFIIYDGNTRNVDTARMFGYLEKYTPAGQKPIIDLWLITHFHFDHVTGMRAFGQDYGERVEVRNIAANFPIDENIVVREKEYNSDFYRHWWPQILAIFDKAKVWKLHVGQTFYVADIKIEVLLTHECIYPNPINTNDTSTVTMMYIGGKKILLSGDIQGEYACRLIHDAYGAYLKCDYLQAAHHGWDTEMLYFYDDADAPCVLWPLRKRDWLKEKLHTRAATIRMESEMKEKKREFFITIDDDHVFEF